MNGKWDFIKKTAHILLSHLYPSFCLMCRKPISSGRKVCDTCVHELELIEPLDRCPFCFSQRISCHFPCIFCFKHPPHPRIFGQACCLQESSLTNLLLQYLYKRAEYHLEMALASLVYIQLHRLRWPKPDCILMEPTHWILPGSEELALSKRIARHLASFFHVPCLKASLKPFSLKDPFISLEKQTTTGQEEIALRLTKPLHGKNILLFILKLHKGNTWKAAAKTLELHGLSRMWNIGLIASEHSWMA